MRRLLLILALTALAAPAAARADDPSEACGPLACASAHTHLTIACGENGRDPGACAGVVTSEALVTSILPVGSATFEHELVCEAPCFGATSDTGSCSWAGLPDAQEPGDPGCAMNANGPYSMIVPVPSSGCVTASLSSVLRVRHAIDPGADITDVAEATVEVCAA